jgi:hypothetical protein
MQNIDAALDLAPTLKIRDGAAKTTLPWLEYSDHCCQVPEEFVCNFTKEIWPNLKKFSIFVILFFIPI